MKKTICTVLLLVFAVSAAVWSQTGSGIKNYVVTIEGFWIGPAGDPRAGKSVYGTYTISARSETEALSEARSRFRGEYPSYRNVGERVVNTTPTNTRPAQEAMSPSSGSASSSRSAPSASSAPLSLTSEQELYAFIVFALRGNNYDTAIRLLTDAIRLDPNNASHYGLRGAVYYDGKRDYDRAIADLTSAIRLEQNKANYYNNRGDAYNSKGDYDRAIADYTSAIRLDPNETDYYNSRINAYNSKGDHDSAIADCSSLIRLYPNNAYYYNSRANAYNSKRDYDSAIADCTSAIRLDPNFTKAYRARALALNRKNNPDAAVPAYPEGEGQLLLAREGNKVINGVRLEVFDGVLRMTDTNSDNVIRSVVYVLYFADGSSQDPSTLTLGLGRDGRKINNWTASSRRLPVIAAEIIEVSAESQP
jgi:tetratricopeptide (TPR) repeat protein